MPTNSGIDLQWLSLPAKRESLEDFQRFVMTAAETLSLPPPVLGKIDLVMEEVLLNVMDYAYPTEQPGDMQVGWGRSGEGVFRIVVRDQGRPFNPLEQKTPNLTADIDERIIGGLGVFLTKKMADKLHYRREQGKNILEIDFLPGAAQQA